jgi:hypothetical protein
VRWPPWTAPRHPPRTAARTIVVVRPGPPSPFRMPSLADAELAIPVFI